MLLFGKFGSSLLFYIFIEKFVSIEILTDTSKEKRIFKLAGEFSLTNVAFEGKTDKTYKNDNSADYFGVGEIFRL